MDLKKITSKIFAYFENVTFVRFKTRLWYAEGSLPSFSHAPFRGAQSAAVMRAT